MISKIISGLLIAIAIVAAWKYFDGNLTMALNTISDGFLQIVDAGSNVLLNIIDSVKQMA